LQTVCSTTANIIMPQVRQLHRWRRQWQRRYLVSVVYESWPTFSAFHYIFAGTVESIALQQCQQCQSWIQGLWCYDFTVGYDLSSRKSIDIRPTASGPSSPTPSPYDSDDCVCDCGCADVDQSSLKSDDLTGPTCPAPSLYDSNTNDEDDSDEDDSYDSDGFTLSRRATSVTQGSICPTSTPYDSNATDDDTSGDASSQWSMSLDLPSDAQQQQQQQQTYDPTLMAYKDDDYTATAQPSSSSSSG